MKFLYIGTALLALTSAVYCDEGTPAPEEKPEGENKPQEKPEGGRPRGPPGRRGPPGGGRRIRMTKEQFEEFKKSPQFQEMMKRRGQRGGMRRRPQGGDQEGGEGAPAGEGNGPKRGPRGGNRKRPQGGDAPAGEGEKPADNAGEKPAEEKKGGRPNGGQGGQRKQRPQGGNGGNAGGKNESPSTGGGSTAGGSAMASEVIAAHQAYRKEFNCPELKWSDKIASVAQKWADHLASTGSFQHSKGSGYGENLAMGGGKAFTNKAFVDMWGGEKKDYKEGTFPNVFKPGKSWSDVGHYTQVIWKKTTEVGCGRASGSKGTYFVCNYNPPGNFNGQKPY